MPKKCATMDVHRRLLLENPGMASMIEQIERRVSNHSASSRAEALAAPLSITVVVHVVYSTAIQNIADDQIRSQIEVLNEDYSASNSDIGQTPAPFVPSVGKAGITFALATVDPSGQPTSGITRTSTDTASFTSNDDVKAAATGGADPWNQNNYLNLWVCHLVDKDHPDDVLLGYAQLPGGPAATDGVVISYKAFGRIGTATKPNNLGRTATHEIGHWLGLHHLWGDEDSNPTCALEVGVYDTPNQAAPNKNVPDFPHISCNNGPDGDMFMNFMDYVSDRAMVMFTSGQVGRMRNMLTKVRMPSGLPAVNGAPALLGVENDADDGGNFSGQLWLAFTEQSAAKRVWLLSSDNGALWTVASPDVTGAPAASAPAITVSNKQMWIAVTQATFTGREVFVYKGQDSTTFNPAKTPAWPAISAPAWLWTEVPNNGLQQWLAFTNITTSSGAYWGNISRPEPTFQRMVPQPMDVVPAMMNLSDSYYLVMTLPTQNAAWTYNKIATAKSSDGITFAQPKYLHSPTSMNSDTAFSPAMAGWADGLWLAYTGDKGISICTRRENDDAWSEPVLIPGTASSAGPSLTSFGRYLFLAFVAQGGEHDGHVVVLSSEDGQDFTHKASIELADLVAQFSDASR